MKCRCRVCGQFVACRDESRCSCGRNERTMADGRIAYLIELCEDHYQASLDRQFAEAPGA